MMPRPPYTVQEIKTRDGIRYRVANTQRVAGLYADRRTAEKARDLANRFTNR